jgi:hypothetical protein
VSAIDSLADYDRAYLVYTDLHAFPEGGVFWTRGTEKTRVVVASRGASRLVLTLSTGPMSGDVTVTAAGGKPVMVRVASGEAKELSFDVEPGSRLVPITVQSTVRFYPADADPSSRDMRQLGCHVRVALK